MYKIVLSLCCVMFFSCSSFASPGFKFMPLKPHPVLAPTFKQTYAPSVEATDFSGSWHGECQLDDESSPIDLMILQGPSSLSITSHDGEDTYEIGDLKTRGVSSQSMYDFSLDTLVWNRDKTALVFHGRSIATGAASDIFTYFDKLTLSMEQEKLKLAFEVVWFNDMTQYYQNQGTCLLSKKIDLIK
ncbi:MAG: hypothetical protein ACOYKA_05750 [Legionellaceae bacterium]